MRPVTDKFLAALRGPHRTVTTVDAYYGPNGVRTGTDLPLLDGSISCDRGSNIRRTLSATFGPGLGPTAPDSPLSPYGSQLQVTRSMVFPDGTQEPVELGWYRINQATGNDDGTWNVDAADLFAIVADAVFLSPRSTLSTDLTTDVIAAMITEVIPSAVVTVTASGTTRRPGVITFESDRAAAIAELATGIGAECYATADGGFVIADLPDLDTYAPVWTVDTGPTGVLVAAPDSHTRDDLFNGVIIRADDTTGSAGVWQHVEVDLDSSSPTYWEGPFGKVATEYASPSIRTVDQAAAAAAGILAEHLGVAHNVDLTMVPNFALEPGDVITVERDGTPEAHLIETLSIPLTVHGEMTATTRGRVNPVSA